MRFHPESYASLITNDELIERRGMISPKRVAKLQEEAVQLSKIFNATRTSALSHKS